MNSVSGLTAIDLGFRGAASGVFLLIVLMALQRRAANQNRHRIEDARLALSDATQREVPVLTIAMDAGFQWIGPFNRAFKAETGVTPSEFRREVLSRPERADISEPRREIG